MFLYLVLLVLRKWGMWPFSFTFSLREELWWTVANTLADLFFMEKGVNSMFNFFFCFSSS
jgi:hypothetical protein